LANAAASFISLTDAGSTRTKYWSVLQIRRTRTQLKAPQTEFQVFIFFASSSNKVSLQLVSVRNWFPPLTKDYITATQTVLQQ